MYREEDVNFLKEFRSIVDEYLFLGYAPAEGSSYGDNGKQEMRESLKNPEFAELRRKLNEMAPRVHSLLGEVNLHNIVSVYPAPAVGGPVRSFKLFDLVTRNGTSKRMDKHEFLDPIDQAIGALHSMEDNSVSNDDPGSPAPSINHLVFVAMPMEPTDANLEDVHNAIKEVVGEFKLDARRVDDFQTNDRITDTLLEAIRDARLVVVDLTHGKPNVYLEAGYALGRNKTPIFIARQDTVIEFDLIDYPILFFRNITELKRKLNERLTSILAG